MNLLENLKDKLTTPVIEKLGSFLGETPDDITVAMNAALPTMLGGVVQKVSEPNGATKLLDIIKDGGHTGDILSDLPSILNNPDKTQLLTSIGGNIFNHFLGANASIFTDRVASLSGVRKSSATSLLGLAAPLVLGIIGRSVRQDNLTEPGLINLLNDQRESVKNALSPSLSGFINLGVMPAVPTESGSTHQVHTPSQATPPKKEVQKPAQTSVLTRIFPWLLLAALALASAYYLRNCDTSSTNKNAANTDSLQMVIEESNKAAINATDSARAAQEAVKAGTATPPEQSNSAVEKPASNEKKVDEKEATTATESNKPTSSQGSTSTKSSASSQSSETTSKATTNDAASSGISLSQLQSKTGWLSSGTSVFRSNSAEISSNNSTINNLASYLKRNTSATLQIAPAGNSRLAEDRAYAIRDILIEKGIDEGRVQVVAARSGNSGAGIRIVRN